MSLIVAAEPVLAGAATQYGPRPRQTAGELPLLPDSARPADDGQALPDPLARRRDERAPAGTEPEAGPEPASVSGGAAFAAAVLAGSLPPTPESLTQLLRRIGSAEIPEESLSRLKDLVV